MSTPGGAVLRGRRGACGGTHPPFPVAAHPHRSLPALPRMKNTFLVAAALLGAASAAGAQTTIGASGGMSISPFGNPNTQTYGQTFTVPTNGDDVLNAFSFWMNPTTGLSFRGYVFAWDGTTSRATGSALFTSAIMSAPASGSGFQPVTVSNGGLSLGGGSMYVAFLSASGLAGSNTTQWEWSTGDTYAGGEFVFLNNGEDTAAWTSQPWHTDWNGTNRDVRFEMQFSAGQVSAVPEPATVALSAAGLLALGGLGAYRRRRAALQG